MAYNIIDEICRVVKKYTGMEISPDLAIEVAEHLGEDTRSIDTAEREMAIDYICMKVCGMRWPANCDSPEYVDKFYRELLANAHKFGITVLN